MTAEEFKTAMEELIVKYGDDPERFHVYADGLICSLLVTLGYEGGVQLFINQPKYYA